MANKYEKDPYSPRTGRAYTLGWSGYEKQEIPEEWIEISVKAEMLSEEYGRTVDDAFEAIWYPRYETAAADFRIWVNGRIDAALEKVGELRPLISMPIAPGGGRSISDIGDYYRAWLVYAVSYSINDALEASPRLTEMQLLLRIETVFNSIQAQAEREVLDRLAEFKKQSIWYRTWLRPYLFRSVPLTYTFYKLLGYVREALRINLLRGAGVLHKALPSGAAMSAGDIQAAMAGWWEKYRIIVHIEDWFPKALEAIRKFISSSQKVGIVAGPGAAAFSVSVSPWLAVFAIIIIALSVRSIRVDAPTIDDATWNDWMEQPEAPVIEAEARQVAQEIDDLDAQISGLGGLTSLETKPDISMKGFTQPDDTTVVESVGLSFTDVEEEYNNLVTRINTLTLPSIGAEPLAEIKAELFRRLETKAPREAQASEVRAAEELDISDEEIALFMNPLDVFEILAPTLESMVGGQTEFTDEEFEDLLNRAMARNEEGMETYGEQVAQKILETRAIAVEAPTELDGVEAAVEGLEALQELGLSESVDVGAYQTVLMQLRSTAGYVPAGMNPKLEAGIAAAERLIGAFNDPSGSTTED